MHINTGREEGPEIHDLKGHIDLSKACPCCGSAPAVTHEVLRDMAELRTLLAGLSENQRRTADRIQQQGEEGSESA